MRNVQYFSFLPSDSDLDTTADDIKIEKKFMLFTHSHSFMYKILIYFHTKI